MQNVHLKRPVTEKHRKCQRQFSRVSKKLQINGLLKTNYQKKFQKNWYNKITEDRIWARKLRNKTRKKSEIIYRHKCPMKGNKSQNRCSWEQSHVGQNWEIKTWRINLTSQIKGEKDLKIIIKKIIDVADKGYPTIKILLFLKKRADKWNKKWSNM